jgi:hypothetical protein
MEERDCSEAPVALYQIACLSCGYHRAWPTLLEAHTDGHRHHAEHAASRAAPALPVPQLKVQRPEFTDTRERICPQCHSADVLPLGRVLANTTGIRSVYRCRECATEFFLFFPDRRAWGPAVGG